MKRFISLVVCILLVMSMATTAFAEDVQSILINGKAPNHKYVAYQIFKGNVSNGVISDPQWGESLGDNGPAFLEALKNDTWLIKNSTNPNHAGTTMKDDLSEVSELNSLVVRMGAWGNDLDRIDYFAHFLMYGTKADTGEKRSFLTNTSYDNGQVATYLGDNEYAFYNFEPGYYMIVDEGKFDEEGNKLPVGDNEYFSKFMVYILDGKEPITVSVKGDYPKVTKGVGTTIDGNYVDAITNQIGKIHYYEFEGTVPTNINNFTFYRYIFKDPLAEGLDFNRLEEVYILNNTGTKVEIYKAPAEGQTDPWHSTSYKLDYFGLEMENGKEVLTVGWNNLLAKYQNLRPSDKIYVRYSASLNENAVIGQGGTVNQVYLEFSNDPYNSQEYGHTPKNDARVYTFGLDIKKVDGNTKNPLSGAEFYLYHYHSEDNVDTPVYAKVTLKEGVYYIDEWVKDYKVLEDNNHKPIFDEDGNPQFVMDTEGNKQLDNNPMYVPDATSMVSAPDTGEIKIYGLQDTIIYYLVETKAPDQYKLLDYNPSVQITKYTPGSAPNYEVQNITYSINGGTGVTTSGNGVELSIAKISIGNNLGAVLPSTGGMGTTILYAAGGILVLAALILLITKKRMANAE